jgi:CubicO group peptidase (beta-lactamase class C family)
VALPGRFLERPVFKNRDEAVKKLQFRVLYREFLFRIVDLELLSAHAEGDSRTLLGQLASILVFFGLVLAVAAGLWAASVRGGVLPPLMQMAGAWTVEHFLIATTMLVVGLFAVLSWESTFPDKRDVLVLGPLPVRSGTLFLAKAAAVASALGLTLVFLHGLAGIAWPLALAQYDSTPAPAMAFDPPIPPVHAADFPAVMNRDIAPMLRRLDLAAADGGAGIVIGVAEHGVRRVMTYGTAKPDSLFEIGSITKTFTGLLLAQLSVQGKLDLRDPVRELLPPGVARTPAGFEITLLDLATHHSGLPGMPDNPHPGGLREMYTDYHATDLYDFIRRHGVGKSTHEKFAYSNLGFTILGAALATRAGTSYPDLVQSQITGPLGMKDTAISLPPELLARLIQGYDGDRQPTPRWDLDAFASAGGIRSTAGDMLTYLEAQLHPERSPFAASLVRSQRIRDHVDDGMDIALAWLYDVDRGMYWHNGGTGGYSAYACFNPKRDFAAVMMFNSFAAAYPFNGVLSEHVVDRILGKPALSLAPISVPPAGPVRSFFAYWIAMLSAGVFMFCCVLALQGFSALLLPRRWSLRASAFLQLAVLCLLVSGYFLQQSPVTVLTTGARRPWLSWIPSYWFVGMYQQISGSLHPALAPFARRAWIGLAIAVSATAAAYAASYFRTLRRIVEEPDIAPVLRSGWLPRFGGLLETALVQFSVRSLLRSRQHRMIFAFYLGAGFAISILFLNAPAAIVGPTTGGPWDPLSIPLLASTILLMGFWVVGARVAFSLPLDLGANWIFRTTPLHAGPQCLRARRRALLSVSVAPAFALSAAVLFSLWPWRQAAAHLAVLALLGIILAEFSFDSTQKIPFACSYLPGKSNLHLTFWLWMVLVFVGIIEAAVNEHKALESAVGGAILLGSLAIVAASCMLVNNRLAAPDDIELRFEEVQAGHLQSLNL